MLRKRLEAALKTDNADLVESVQKALLERDCSTLYSVPQCR